MHGSLPCMHLCLMRGKITTFGACRHCAKCCSGWNSMQATALGHNAQLQSHLGAGHVWGHLADILLSQSRVGCIVDSRWPLVLNEEMKVNIAYKLPCTEWPHADAVTASNLSRATMAQSAVWGCSDTQWLQWCWRLLLLYVCFAGAQSSAGCFCGETLGQQQPLNFINT